jgi:2-hydroxy-3-oxopropionate reductase
MSKNLMKKGYQLTVFDIVKERVESLVALGAEAAKSAKQVAEKTDVIITMVPSSPHVREVVLGKDGIMEGAKKGSTLIDMSTIDPMTSRDLSEKLLAKGIHMLDAPVARSHWAAESGTLAIFVGGKKETYEQCKDVLSAMGSDIYYIGGPGSGEVIKVVNNLIVMIELASLSEALVIGVKAGVEPDTLVKALCEGSANSFALQNYFKDWVLKGKFEKGFFPINYVIKDLGLAMSLAAEYHVPCFFGALATQAFEQARAAGYSELFAPAIIRPLEELTGVKVRSKGIE